MTLADFDRDYREVMPNHEYWFGEAISKAAAAWPHGLLQGMIATALDEAGYRSATEVTLKISEDFAPVPDVMAATGRFERPYPIRPMGVVIEILSPEDSFQRVLRKCRLYSEWGVPVVVVLDPEAREAWIWQSQSDSLKTTPAIPLENGRDISLDRIFQELETELQ